MSELDELLSPGSQRRNRYEEGISRYAHYPGPDVPIGDIPEAELMAADAMLAQNDDASSLLARGWLNMEYAFYAPDTELAERAHEQVNGILDLGIDVAAENNQFGYLAELYLGVAATHVYRPYSEGQPMSDEGLVAYKKALVDTGISLCEWWTYDLDDHDTFRLHRARSETAALLALNHRRGDTRKPIEYVAVPATFRQQHGQQPHAKKTDPRRNWHVGRLRYQGDWGGGTWKQVMKFFVQPAGTLHETTADVRSLQPDKVLSGARSSNVGDIALRLLVKEAQGAQLTSEEEENFELIMQAFRKEVK